MFRMRRTALLAGFACLAPAVIAAQDPTATAPYGAWGFDVTAMDRGTPPGQDFNTFANGAWNARTPIPADKTIVSLRTAMSDVTETRLHRLLEDAAAQPDEMPRAENSKLGAFYAAFMDKEGVETLGVHPIQPELDAVRDAHDRSALARLMGQYQTDFFGSIFALSPDVDLNNPNRYAIYVSQAGLGLPDRDYYLQPGFAVQRAAYTDYVGRMLTLAGWSDAKTVAAQVVAFEARIADASWSKAQQRDVRAAYNPMDVRDLGRLAPGVDWSAFLSGADLASQKRVVIAEKSAFPAIATIYATTPMPVLKAWLAFTVVDNAAFYLSKPFTDERFAFRDHILAGQAEPQVRWKRAILAVGGGDCGATGNIVDCFGHMDFGLGQLYTARYFPAADKARIEALVGNVKAAMRVRLEHLDWMGPATKTEALRKLDTYQIKVGYPDHARDYSGLRIMRDDLVGNVRRSARWNWAFQVSRLAGPVDRSAWSMTPQTNDAYNGSLRDIVFPAAILQAPMFDPAADAAINYGAIGAVIGHELTHGFDDEGRKLDAEGRLRDWWTTADAAAFEDRAKRLGVQYSAFEPVPGAHVNGTLTMGENIADLGGLTVALDAYHRALAGRPAPTLDGFSGDQRVFLGWAQAWRGHTKDDYVRKQVVTDPHTPRQFRINGPTRNIDAWYAAFGVLPGQRFYIPPAERVRIW